MAKKQSEFQIVFNGNLLQLGQRKVKFLIPTKYITVGSHAKKPFNIGVLNLETIFPGEERKIL